jgi:hypothetical protein
MSSGLTRGSSRRGRDDRQGCKGVPAQEVVKVLWGAEELRDRATVPLPRNQVREIRGGSAPVGCCALGLCLRETGMVSDDRVDDAQ